MPPRIDLTGQKFGRLTVTGYSHTTNRKSFWRCVCECGNTTIVYGESLKKGHTQSCGCLQREITRRRVLKHGQRHSRLYRIWCDMKTRCYSPNRKIFKYYGGRGIIVCDEWKNDFQTFYDWATANGYHDDLTIDRIDVNGNYCPENCRWITMKEQCNNRTSNHLLTYNGRTMTIAEWSEETNISSRTIEQRLNRHGWSVDRALTTPVRPLKKEK